MKALSWLILALLMVTPSVAKGDSKTDDAVEKLMNRAEQLFDKKERDCVGAMAKNDEAVKLAPNASRIPRYLAYLSRGLNGLKCRSDVTVSIRDFDEAIRIAPDEFGAYQNRALAYHQLGRLDDAIKDADMAISVTRSFVATQAKPTSGQQQAWNRRLSEIYNIRALTRIRQGLYDQAISDTNEAIHLARDNPRPYGTKSVALRFKGDLTDAIMYAQKTTEVALRGSLPRVYLADAYRYNGNFGSALRELNDAIKETPDMPAAYVSRGLTHERLDDLRSARADYRKALEFPEYSYDTSREAQVSAKARLAALDSGALQPVIQPLPGRTEQNAVPTKPAVAPQPAISKPPVGRRAALVIGNSSYKTVPALRNPENDANAVATSLRNIGFDSVTLVNDATRESMINALRAFASEAENAEWALVYYAGHGIEVGGANYLIPVDAKLAVDRDIEFEAVPVAQVLSAANTAKKLRLVLLDACRDNPFKPRSTLAPQAGTPVGSTAGAEIKTRSIGRGFARVDAANGTLVVFAAKDGQVALDGEGRNSPFAVALVQRIATPGVEINKIFRLVRDDVMEATAGRQEPYTYGSLPGREDFFFVNK